ncbi:MAG TPA: hypothetical protein GXZ87_03825 [Bacteroidales bacterium]|nr:hypothetical protein [Bacteroidales bacterium]
MKYLNLFLLFWSIMIVSNAQQLSSSNQIAIATDDVYSTSNIPSSINNQMHQQLRAVLSSAGIGSESYYNRFIIRPSYEIVSKEAIESSPVKFVINVTIGLSLVDAFNDKVFATYLDEFTGVGNSEGRAMAASIKQLRVENAKLSRFIDDARKKVIDYYDGIGDRIIQQAFALAAMNREEEALFQLNELPEECKSYSKALDAMVNIYSQMSDRECSERLLKAKALWAASKHGRNLSEIVELIGGVSPKASCYGEVKAFIEEISKKTEMIENREWQMLVNRENNRQALYKAQIEAARAIGVAYAKRNTQPQINIIR